MNGIFAILLQAAGMLVSPVAAQAPAAVVEEVGGGVTGVQFMDYVEPGQVIRLGGHDRIDEAVIEFQSFFVWLAPSRGQDARPSRGQAVGADAEFAHQRDVLRPTVVMVACNIAVVAAENLAGQMAESIPDRRPAPVLGDGTLDLVGRRRSAPQKTVRKTGRHLAVP